MSDPSPTLDAFMSWQLHEASRCEPLRAVAVLHAAWRYLRRRGALNQTRRAVLRRAITTTFRALTERAGRN